MDKLFSFAIIIFGVVTPVTIVVFYILFRKSLTFKIGIIVTLLLDTISILSFVNGAGGELSTMIWMGPLGVSIIVLGFFIIIKSLKNFDKLTKQIELIADKDINTDIEEYYLERKDEIGNIARAISRMRKNQVEMFSEIERGSIEIENLSKNLTSIAQMISQSANEQASTTEETLSSMEEINEALRLNSEEANKASIVSSKSANEIENSNEAFIQTIQSVSDISEKISIISDIAYQTNILSLNASVEAARAGEFGKGFGVVAHEIRKLADTTNMASSEIEGLSRKGIGISEEARNQLQKIVPEIIESAEMVKKITASSKEQQAGAEMVKSSIQQLSETTNQNSASSEQMLASAEELSALAKQMRELMGNI